MRLSPIALPWNARQRGSGVKHAVEDRKYSNLDVPIKEKSNYTEFECFIC